MPEPKKVSESAPAAEPKSPVDASEKNTEKRPGKTVQDTPAFSFAAGAPKRFAWSLAFLAEANMNSPVNPASGTGMYALFVLPFDVKLGNFSAGVKALYSHDFNKHHLFDTALLFRWNFYDFASKPHKDSGFFIQAEGGAVLSYSEHKKAGNPLIFGLGQASFGYRRTINNFFIEPYIRGGYPVVWAVGLAGGIRFGD
ncbi:hypothetical protein H0R92_03005 [Treponema sp. OMZ 840]|uniref:hypothetical protein n=1 Tax=Treponema sp. OMZ 840 TaxID=244313 RepID=UPI003D90BD29